MSSDPVRFSWGCSRLRPMWGFHGIGKMRSPLFLPQLAQAQCLWAPCFEEQWVPRTPTRVPEWYKRSPDSYASCLGRVHTHTQCRTAKLSTEYAHICQLELYVCVYIYMLWCYYLSQVWLLRCYYLGQVCFLQNTVCQKHYKNRGFSTYFLKTIARAYLRCYYLGQVGHF